MLWIAGLLSVRPMLLANTDFLWTKKKHRISVSRCIYAWNHCNFFSGKSDAIRCEIEIITLGLGIRSHRKLLFFIWFYCITFAPAKRHHKKKTIRRFVCAFYWVIPENNIRVRIYWYSTPAIFSMFVSYASSFTFWLSSLREHSVVFLRDFVIVFLGIRDEFVCTHIFIWRIAKKKKKLTKTQGNYLRKKQHISISKRDSSKQS